jgi:protocatechuate 3,4-dioxygenase beta subunit
MTRFRRRSAPAPELRPEHFSDNESYVRAVHDQGLAFDLGTLSTAIDRRRALMVLGGGTLALAGCAAQPASTATSSPTSSTTSSSTAAGGTVGEIPEETAGPYPGDGSNGPDALAEDGIVRRDIRSSFGSSTTTAAGVPLTIELALVDVAGGGAPLAGAAIYLWHCDREGRYSMYSGGVEDENYLRGVQVADDDGRLTFTTVFPACYSGRWPHAHFEVFSSVDDATGDGRALVTSQLALPEDVCTTVFATDGYEDSVRNLDRVSLDSDMVFSDGVDDQMAAVTGSVDEGYTASLTVGV